ncbi:MAG: hypothetical protein KAT70_09295, partial [Thermoplasmata archaeon]|nr:hypothetical protein [Thermoplasmata archaeon]
MDKLSALTLDQALKSMKDEGARAVIVKEIDDLKRKTDMSNVKNLATDQIFTLRDSSGEIRAYKQRCVLSLKDKTLTKAGEGGDLVISAQGYEVWAEATGTSVVFPTHVMVDGKPVANPHVERDPKNRRILSVTARAVAYRFSSKGIPQVSDWTTIFDAPSYRMIDLLAKAKKYKDAFILRPVETGPPEEEGTWAAYPNDESTTLWILTSHDEALTWYSQILNREKKAMDFAQTFAKRNAVKHLCALQKAPGPTWEMSVICWRPTSGNIIKWDGSTYAQLQDNAGKLSGGAGEQFNTKQIEAQTG